MEGLTVRPTGAPAHPPMLKRKGEKDAVCHTPDKRLPL